MKREKRTSLYHFQVFFLRGERESRKNAREKSRGRKANRKKETQMKGWEGGRGQRGLFLRLFFPLSHLSHVCRRLGLSYPLSLLLSRVLPLLLPLDPLRQPLDPLPLLLVPLSRRQTQKVDERGRRAPAVDRERRRGDGLCLRQPRRGRLQLLPGRGSSLLCSDCVWRGTAAEAAAAGCRSRAAEEEALACRCRCCCCSS